MAASLEVPDFILEGLSARPDDVGVWQVLTDFLLENDAPGASLAMCELELMKGISNPELLGQLADARAQRPKLPHEPWGGYQALWKCGFVVRLTLDVRSARGVLMAPAVRGLHMLSLVDESGRFGTTEPRFSVAARVGELLEAATPHLHRVAVRLEALRSGPVDTSQQRAVVAGLLSALPKKVQRLDLALGALHEASQAKLVELARRVPSLNLDGTRLPHSPGFVAELVAAGAQVFCGGTGLPKQEYDAVVKHWLAPDVAAWVERLDTGALIPLTPTTTSEGFEAPAWPRLRAALRRDLLGWSRAGQVLDTTAEFSVDGVEVKFTQR